MLCYVCGLITGILFLVLSPYNQDKVVRFHAFQSIFFHLAWIAFWILNTLLGRGLPWTLEIVRGAISLVVFLAAVTCWVVLMIRAYRGEQWKLPVIGDLAAKEA